MSKLTMSKFTAMQELIKFMQKRSENTNLIANAAYSIAIRKATELLETERQQHIETWDESRINIGSCPIWNCEGDEKKWQLFEQYFTQTFTQK